MTNKINPDGSSPGRRCDSRQLTARGLVPADPLPRHPQQKAQCGTFCGSCLPELGQLTDGLIVFEGQA